MLVIVIVSSFHSVGMTIDSVEVFTSYTTLTCHLGHFRDILCSQSRSMVLKKLNLTRMWANAQPDGRPAKHRWRCLFNAAKFG